MSDRWAQSTAVEPEAPATDDRVLAFVRFAESLLVQHYQLATVILGNPTDAQDAVHDAFERAWRSGANLRDLDRFDAWVGRIVVNECRDRLRLRRRRPVTDISERLGETLAAPDPLRSAVDRDEIQRAFAALTPDQQVAIALRFYADLTIDQIAQRVSAPVGTVKSRSGRAHKRLASALAHLVANRTASGDVVHDEERQ